MNWIFISKLTCTGIAMGILTTFVGLGIPMEPILWILFYIIWIVLIVRNKINRPFLSSLIASLISGILCASIQVTFLNSYIAHNPWSANQLQGGITKLAPTFYGIGIVYGLVFGSIVGLFSMGILEKKKPSKEL